MNPEKRADDLVEMLSSTIHWAQDLTLVPGILKDIITEDVWRVRRPRKMPGREFHYRTFAEFVEDHPPQGLGCDVRTLQNVCRDDAEAHNLLMDLLNPAAMSHQEAGHLGGRGNKAVRITNSFDRSDTAPYTIRRLKRDRPELAEQVIRGELSPNAAAIKAGFRKKTITVPLDVDRAARALLKHFTADEIEQIIERFYEVQA